MNNPSFSKELIVDISYLLGLLQGAKELADTTRGVELPRNMDGDRRAIVSLIETLRRIYFSPKGVIVLLEEIAEGRQPNSDQVEALLTNFNDAETAIGRSRSHLDAIELRSDGRLTLKARKVLSEISDGKGGVRQKVQQLLNEALTYEQKISHADARKILTEISQLNGAIEDAEEALVRALI